MVPSVSRTPSCPLPFPQVNSGLASVGTGAAVVSGFGEGCIIIKSRDQAPEAPVTHQTAAVPLCKAELRAISQQEMKFTF